MKKFQLFLNERKEDDEIVSYKNYIFKDGIIILDNCTSFSWKYFKNYNKTGKYNIKTKKDGVVFQFIQGNPVISVPVSKDKSGNIVIDDINSFYTSNEFKQLKRYVDLKNIK